MVMMRGWAGPGLAALLAVAAPVAAIEVCRVNALGQIACMGKPTEGLLTPEPFTPDKTGLSRVQRAPGAGNTAPSFVPAIRTNSFGDTQLRPGESSPPKPRICKADSFGDLRC